MSVSNPSERCVGPADTSDAFWRQLRDNVREMLEARGMTQRELADASGIPYSTLNKKLRGVRQVWWLVEFAGLYGAFDGDEMLFRGLTETIREARAA